MALLLAVGIGSSATAATDAELIRQAESTMAAFRAKDPGLARFFENAAGYVVIPTVGKGAAGIGGAHGTGVLFGRGGRPIGRVTLNQVTIGLQLGGQSYSEIIFLETPKELANMESGKFELAAQASAVALKAGVSANVDYSHGVAIITATKGGLMYEASVGGQKFGFERFGTK